MLSDSMLTTELAPWKKENDRLNARIAALVGQNTRLDSEKQQVLEELASEKQRLAADRVNLEADRKLVKDEIIAVATGRQSIEEWKKEARDMVRRFAESEKLRLEMQEKLERITAVAAAEKAMWTAAMREVEAATAEAVEEAPAVEAVEAAAVEAVATAVAAATAVAVEAAAPAVAVEAAATAVAAAPAVEAVEAVEVAATAVEAAVTVSKLDLIKQVNTILDVRIADVATKTKKAVYRGEVMECTGDWIKVLFSYDSKVQEYDAVKDIDNLTVVEPPVYKMDTMRQAFKLSKNSSKRVYQGRLPFPNDGMTFELSKTRVEKHYNAVNELAFLNILQMNLDKTAAGEEARFEQVPVGSKVVPMHRTSRDPPVVEVSNDQVFEVVGVVANDAAIEVVGEIIELSSTPYYEGDKGDKHLVRIDYPDGKKEHYEGNKGEEFLVRTEEPNGRVFHYAGDRGEEHIVRSVLADGAHIYYEGNKGEERAVRAVYVHGRVDHLQGNKGEERFVRSVLGNGKVLHFEGNKGEERISQIVRTDGSVKHFEGNKGEERKVRIVFTCGRVDHYEGNKGEERLVRKESDWEDAYYDGVRGKHFEGNKGEERLVRLDGTDGSVNHYEGNKGEERLVRVDCSDLMGRMCQYDDDQGKARLVRRAYADGDVQHYEGNKGEERLVRVECCDGTVGHFEGNKRKQHLVRIEYAHGEVHYYEGNRGEERLMRCDRSCNVYGGQLFQDEEVLTSDDDVEDPDQDEPPMKRPRRLTSDSQSDLQTIFNACYVVQRGAKAIRSEDMHNTLVLHGLVGVSKKMMNRWIGDTYPEDQPPHFIERKYPHNALAFKGFALKA